MRPKYLAMDTFTAELENLRRLNREDSPAKAMAQVIETCNREVNGVRNLLGGVKDLLVRRQERSERMFDLLGQWVDEVERRGQPD